MSGGSLRRKTVAHAPWWAAGLSAFTRVLGDAMTNNSTPGGAGDLGIWANLGVWVAFGAAFGLLFGVIVGGFFDNVALSLGLGLSLGAGLGVSVGSVVIARRNARGRS